MRTMNIDYAITTPEGIIFCLILLPFLLGWLLGCLIFIAEAFTEIRLILQGVPFEERAKRHRVLNNHIQRESFD
tara:strand:- start:8168 stop:8389 length:222 start_codon:yes stop_codon:yes gene_type:complete